jgi:putative transposase
VQATFDKAALVQRCQLYKFRNVMDHLPERQRPWVQAIMRQAYRSDVPTVGPKDLARRLDDEHPSAAESVREGLEETLTVMGFGLSERLQRSLTITNASGQPHARRKRNVKRWRGGKMMLRRVAAGSVSKRPVEA